jgi:sugar O-acyltransferase (sialic acid O-acetyltransferase NeuD family)
MKTKKINILVWGGSSRSHKLITMMKNISILNKKYLNYKSINLKKFFVFDTYVKKLSFRFVGKFINEKKKLKILIKNSKYFIVAIGASHGKARYLISKNLENAGLIPLSLVSKMSILDKTAKIGKGSQIEPGAIIQCHSEIGDYCIINTNSTIEHSSKIGNGCHVMGGASIAGRVHIGNYVSIGTNSTILPDIKVGSGAYIGAGSVVTKNVKENEIVIGIPAKKIGKNTHKVDLTPFKY